MNFTDPHPLRICSGEATGKHHKISGFACLHTHVPMKKGQQKQRWFPSSHTTEYSFPVTRSLHRQYKISFFHRETLHCVASRCCPTVVRVPFSAAIHQQMFLFMLQSVNILPSAEIYLSSIFEVQRTVLFLFQFCVCLSLRRSRDV